MKVSLVHPERRCAQHLVLDVVTPAPPEGFPVKLMPTQRFDFALARGAVLAFVASAAIKAPPGTQLGDFNGLLGPLVIELEAEEGEVLPGDVVRIFRLDTRAAEFCRSHAGMKVDAFNYADMSSGALDSLVKLPAPITLSGDRQQYGMVYVIVHPERDLLIALAAPDRAPVRREGVAIVAALEEARRRGCICREFIGDSLKIEEGCPVHSLVDVLA